MAHPAPDNPPAFPHANPGFDGNWDKDRQIDGMSLRDWFAGHALGATLVAMANGQHGIQPGKTVMESAAADSYAVADAMLAARVQA